MKKLFTYVMYIISSTAMAQAQHTQLDVYGAGNGVNELALCQTIDRDGNIYVAGTATDAGPGEMLLLKYKPDGPVAWKRSFAALESYAQASDVLTDNTGNVYLAGRTCDSVTNVRLLKYDARGNLLWAAAYPDTMQNYLIGVKMMLDSQGNIVSVTGDKQGKLLLLKYTPHGQLVWDRHFSSEATEVWFWHAAIKIDQQDNIYVCSGSSTGYHKADVTVVKFNSLGNALWIRKDHGTMNYLDYANDIDLDAQGNVYVTGLENYTGEQCNGVVLKYDDNGNMLWKRVHDNSDHMGDEFFDIFVSHDGSVYVTGAEDHYGYNVPEPRYVSVTIKYNSNGDELWNATTGSTVHRMGGYRLCVDAGENVYVTGHYRYDVPYSYRDGLFTSKIDPAGAVQWVDTLVINTYANAGITHDAMGHVYVASPIAANGAGAYAEHDITVFRWDAAALATGQQLVPANHLQLYPNPSAGAFIVKDVEENTCAEIIDVTGRKVACISLAAGPVQHVDVPGLPAGSYTVRAVMRDHLYMTRLVIVK